MNRRAWLRTLLFDTAGSAGVDPIGCEEPMLHLQSATGMSDIDWAVLVLAIEVELGVDIPDRLANARKLSVDEFIERVLALPRVGDPLWTYRRFSALAEAFAQREARERRKRGTPSRSGSNRSLWSRARSSEIRCSILGKAARPATGAHPVVLRMTRTTLR